MPAEHSLLIVGHHQAKYFYKHLRSSRRNDVVIRSYDSVHTDGLWQHIDGEVVNHKYVVLVIGGVELSDREETASNVIENYKDLIKNIFAKNGSCKVYMSEILPRWATRRRQSHSYCNTKAGKINETLKEMANPAKNLYFIQHPRFQDASQLPEMLSQYGFQLSHKGSEVVLKQILQSVGNSRRTEAERRR